MRIKRVLYILLFIASLGTYIMTGAYFALVFSWILVAFLIFGILCVKYGGRKLTVTLTAGNDVKKGDEVPFRLFIENRSAFPVFAGKVKLVTENRYTEERAEMALPISLGAKKNCSEEIPVGSDHAGVIEVRTSKTEIFDILGMLSGNRYCEAKAACCVMPDDAQINTDEGGMYGYDPESTVYSEAKKGKDFSEVFEIRDYAPGDEKKNVHWKLSAKNDRLQVREGSFPENTDVVILLNKSMELALIKEADDVKDAASGIVAALSERLLQRGVAHSIAWNEANAEEMQVAKIYDVNGKNEALKKMLESPFIESGVSAAELCASGGSAGKQIMYVSEDKQGTDELQRYGEVKVFRPTKYI